MRVEVDGKDITGVLKNIAITASFDAVFSTVSMVGTLLLTNCTLVVGEKTSYDLILWSSNRDGSAYNMTFVSPIQYKLLMSSVKPVTGIHSFDTLCAKVGVPYLALSPTKTAYYELPMMKFYDFLDWLQNRTICSRAWLMTLHFDGLVGVDSSTYFTSKPPNKSESSFYQVDSFLSGSEFYITARAEGSVEQSFIDKDPEVIELPTALAVDPFEKDKVQEFITVSDLAWVTPNIAKQIYWMNIDTATRMNISSDKVFFVLGALFTDDKGAVFFVNSVSSNEGGQTATLCYIKQT